MTNAQILNEIFLECGDAIKELIELTTKEETKRQQK